MNENPQIRISLEHLRHQMIGVFTNNADEMKRQFDETLAKAMDEFDYEGEIRRMAKPIMEEIAREHIKSTLNSLLYDKDLKKIFLDTMKKRMLDEE